ncbi:peroxidase 1-like [Mercurialis annua]|uniref:peroxidase 1-like n=1 Tax=Mercurialis annua TaxID=3986 RepID=UPI00215FEF8C|nr:peroxidase 1-like [Mercurialis annua]
MATRKLFVFLFCLLFVLEVTNAWGIDIGFMNRRTYPQSTINMGYYRRTCPRAELIAHKTVYNYVARDPTLAAGLLRMYFHDCFVTGCDGSVLLQSTANNKAERDAIPNLTLKGFNVIDAVKSALERECPGVVSCADILALAARDSVLMIGGPFWDVPTGRRDGRTSLASQASAELPSPFANIAQLKQNFAAKGFNAKELAVLSGGHTIGTGHCSIISSRLYNFTGRGDTDPSLDPIYAAQLKKKCLLGGSSAVVAELDPGSVKSFDAAYYSVVANKRGFFQSDAALLDDYETRSYVKFQSFSRGSTFGRDFSKSMEKLGYLGVLTGRQGEIRKTCAFVNKW